VSLVQLPTINDSIVWVNPKHIVYIETTKVRNSYGIHTGEVQTEVCTTMYGRYRTDYIDPNCVPQLIAAIQERGQA
jgi:hypothetical protein